MDWRKTILNYPLNLEEIQNLLFISKYRKLRAHEYKRWIFIVIYAIIYFSIEALAEMYGIEFAIWDTALTISLVILALVVGNLFVAGVVLSGVFRMLSISLDDFFSGKDTITSSVTLHAAS